MYEDLEQIAGLKFGKEVAAISKTMQAELSHHLAGMPRGGAMEATKLAVRIESAERNCRSLYEIWVELITRKNGRLRREDVSFIMGKISRCIAGARSAIVSGPDAPHLASSSESIQMRMSGLSGSLRRELEIKVREQDTFPHSATNKGGDVTILNISNSNVGNLNLGEQIGRIESAIQTIAAKDGDENQKFAEAVSALTEAIKSDPHLSDGEKSEAAQVLSEIAEQAKTEPQKRSFGKLKALLVGFPTLIGTAAHLTKLWEAWGPKIQAYFGL